MSDIGISRGGAVAVDSASLDEAASGLDRVADDLRGLAERARRARDAVVDAAVASGGAGIASAQQACSAFDTAGDRAQDVARSLRHASAVYSIVELTNERTLALAAGDQSRADAAAAQLAAVRAADPGAAFDADLTTVGWRAGHAVRAGSSVADPLLMPLPAWGLALGVLVPTVVAAGGIGLVPRGAVPSGAAPAVDVRPVGPAAAFTAPPASLSAALARIPTGRPTEDDPDAVARVRVEAATMPGGEREYTVYLAGTQDWTGLTGDAFDVSSNGDLYFGQHAPSLEAAKAALAEAGAQPGDALNIVAFSQGAMVGAYLAQDPTYDVRALIAAGSPVATDLPADVLSVSLVHGDDPVPALADAVTGATGSPDSLVVTRDVDPLNGWQDVAVPAHRQDAYVDTARLFEASGDPRVAAVDAFFDRLGAATEVTATEYSAARG